MDKQNKKYRRADKSFARPGRKQAHKPVQIFMNDGSNPLKWYAQLLGYWFSRNPAVFQDYFGNLINNLRGGWAKVLSAPRLQ
jgi:hypothetical protein